MGRSIPLSRPRRFICDLMRYSKQLPLIGFHRKMHLSELVAARDSLPSRPSWALIFAKAYSRVAMRRPELRRSFIGFPWRRLYEHSHNIACMAIERQYRGESGVFFGHFEKPEDRTLADLQTQLEAYKYDPIEKFGNYRRAMRIVRYPWPLRPMLWWHALNVSGAIRTSLFGTFGMSVTAAEGATAVQLLSIAPTTLHYDPFESDGSIVVRVTFDHRVIDGAPIARAMVDLEETLMTELLYEVRELPQQVKSVVAKPLVGSR